MRHFLKHRLSLFVPLLCAALWASASCLAQEQPQVEQGFNLEVIRLKHITAGQAHQALLQLINVPFRSVPDERSNSLLISAPAEVIVSARQIIDRLESAGPPLADDGPMELTVFSLRHIRAHQALELVNTIYLTGGAGPRGLRSPPTLAVDERNNRLLVRAPAQDVEVIESLLKTVDDDASPQTSGDARLRVVWLVNGLADETASPPDDLNEVVGELEKHGVADLKLAAQTFVNLNLASQSSFSAQGTTLIVPKASQHGEQCHLEIEGDVLRSDDQNVRLSIKIEARSQVDNQGQRGRDRVPSQLICGLRTELAFPPGHAVVLGVTPFESMTSVFVVQSLETQAVKKPSAGKPAAKPKGR